MTFVVINPTSIDHDNVLLLPLHIRLGLIKQFVEKLLQKGITFKYLHSCLPTLSDVRLKQGIFFRDLTVEDC